jgi:hypothetical protein
MSNERDDVRLCRSAAASTGDTWTDLEGTVKPYT